MTDAIKNSVNDPLPLIVPSEPGTANLACAVLASLPLSYAEQTGTPTAVLGAVVIVDGRQGWPDRVAAAAQAGGLGVLVVKPQPAECSGVLAALTDAAVSVVLDTPWASNRAVSDAAAAFRSAAGPGRRLECRIILHPGRDLGSALLHQLALVRELVAPASGTRLLAWSERGYAIEATAAGCALDLTLVTTSAVPESARARMLTNDGSFELVIPSPDTARPALLTTVGPSGSLLAPTVYESGHRASWRRLHALITSGNRSTGLADLRALQDDAAEVTSVLSQQHTGPAGRPNPFPSSSAAASTSEGAES